MRENPRPATKRGKVRQVTRISPGAVLYDNGARIVTVADVDEQYSTAVLLGRPISYVASIPAQSKDEITAMHGREVWEKMMYDSQVAGVLSDIIGGALNSQPDILPRDDSAEAQAYAEFVRHNFRLLDARDYPTQYLIEQLVRDALVYGSSVAEMVFVEESPNSEYDYLLPYMPIDDEPRLYTLSRLVRIPSWRFQYRVSAQGDLLGIAPLRLQGLTGIVVPYISSDGHTVLDRYTIPAWKVVHFSWNGEPNSPEGVSYLAPAFKAWSMKKRLEELAMVYADRVARISWVGILPEGARAICVTDPVTGEEKTIDPREELIKVLESLANGEGGVVPFGTRIEAHKTENAAAGQYFIEMLEWLNREILRALTSRMTANRRDAAASTMGETDERMQAKASRRIRHWAESHIAQIARTLVGLNFGWDRAHKSPIILLGRGDGMPYTPKDVGYLVQSGYPLSDEQKRMLDQEIGLYGGDNEDLFGSAVRYSGNLQGGMSAQIP